MYIKIDLYCSVFNVFFQNSRQNGVMNQRVMTGKRRAGAPQMTGLAPMEPLSEGAEENHMLTRVEEVSQTSPMLQKKMSFTI